MRGGYEMDDMRHILLVEDDGKLAATLARGLREDGFGVSVANTCGEADAACAVTDFSLIILDLGLPDGDGIDWLCEARLRGLRVPVLILTARDAVDQRVLGLNSGADDYVAKPFAYSELLARMHALTRRRAPPPARLLGVADLRIDLVARRVSRGAVTVELAPLEFDVLAYLVYNADTVVSRDTLVRDVWKIQHRATSMDNVIDVLITRLREKVDRPFAEALICTVRGVGYQIRDPHA
jgi:two-component system, OmpR family, copper resistance phosphate regulon response regulator CusR